MTYDFSKLEKYLNMLHTEKNLPSADIIVYLKGAPIYRYRIGDEKEDAVYSLYSGTKPITAVAGMQLIERGIIGLDDPVCRYFPEYANATYKEKDKIFTVGEKMKIRHLFTMSAGLDYNCETEAIKKVKKEKPDASTLDIIPAFVKNGPLDFEPGRKFSYSLCLDVLAGVIEIASGMRFSKYLKQNIFDPLQMKSATFHISDNTNLSNAYTIDYSNGKAILCNHDIRPFAITENYESGGAGLYCSASDYGKFAAAMSMGGISNDGIRILKSETTDLLRTPQLSKEEDYVNPGYAYGYGVRTLTTNEYGAKSHIGEFGWDGAAGAYILMDPDAKVAIAYMQQLLEWPNFLGGYMHSPIRDYTYEALGI